MGIGESPAFLVRCYAHELLKEIQRFGGASSPLERSAHELRVQKIRGDCLWDTGHDIWWEEKNGRPLYGSWKICEPHQQYLAPVHAYWRSFDFLEHLAAQEDEWRHWLTKNM